MDIFHRVPARNNPAKYIYQLENTHLTVKNFLLYSLTRFDICLIKNWYPSDGHGDTSFGFPIRHLSAPNRTKWRPLLCKLHCKLQSVTIAIESVRSAINHFVCSSFPCHLSDLWANQTARIRLQVRKRIPTSSSFLTASRPTNESSDTNCSTIIN